MYGASQSKELINPKLKNENKERLNATFELKKQHDELANELKKLTSKVESLGLSEIYAQLQQFESDFVELREKIDHDKTEVYDSIEQYIATATPRVVDVPEVNEIKTRVYDVEKKLDKLEDILISTTTQTTNTVANCDKPRTKLIRPMK
jgi:ElaB/YqjD/DUF883 family membrane-anchored ribosome-binding protein